MFYQPSKKNLYIFVLALSILIIFSLNTASSVEGCCTRTVNEASCDFVEEADCAGDFKAGVTCDEPGILGGQCLLGCCIDYDNGICSPYAEKTSCENNQLIWKEGDECTNINMVPNICAEGCCVINGVGDYIAELECNLNSQTRGVDKDFRNIGFNECSEVHLSGERGACVNDRYCEYTSRGECSNDFYPGKYCSDDSLKELGVSCVKHDSKSCAAGENDVYWYDSCGNKEDVFNDCTDGEEICGLELGEYTCVDVSCGNMKNGESECVYEGLAGEGNDLVGSLHWKKACINGKIEYENCGDARTGICQESITSQTDFSRAFCIPNVVEECFDITSEHYEKLNTEITKYSDKGRFGGTEDGVGGSAIRQAARDDVIRVTTERLMEEMIEACDESNLCMNKNGTIATYFNYAMCVPKDSRKTDTCELADNTCIVYFQQRTQRRWKCVENCDCLEPATFERMNNLCNSVGDCGMKINYIFDDGANNLPYAPENPTKPANGAMVESTIDRYDAIVAFDADCGSGVYEGRDYCLKEKPRVRQRSFKIDFKVKTIPDTLILIGDGFSKWEDDRTEALVFEFPRELASEILGRDYSQDEIDEKVTQYIESLSSDDNIGEDFIYREMYTQGDSWKYIKKQRRHKRNFGANIGNFFGTLFAGRVKRIEVEYECLDWEAPYNGDNCGECGNDDMGCTRYKCESLGQACILINENTNQPICVSLEDDGEAPVIKDLFYDGDSFSTSSNVDLTKNNCLPEGSKIEFNITLSEVARCKYAFQSYSNYNDMPSNYPLGRNAQFEKHGFEINMPNLAGEMEEYEYNKRVDFDITMRCIDSFGHFSEEVKVNYCGITGPDIKPPQVLGYKPENNNEYPYNPKGVNLTVYLDENAVCKWDLSSKNYEDMANQMECVDQEDGFFGYPCFDEISKSDLGSNRIFIRCEDNASNVNSEVYEYEITRDILIDEYTDIYGLKMDSIAIKKGDVSYPSGSNIIVGKISNDVILEVRTIKGIDDGASICYYGFSSDNINSLFQNTESHIHLQSLTALSDDSSYEIFIECSDGITSAESSLSFDFNIDSDYPIMIESIAEDDTLKIITNEESKCSYSAAGRNFDITEGTSFGESDFSLEHITEWNPTITYYVRCVDRYSNQGFVTQIGEGFSEPYITRIYYDQGQLNLNTNKLAQCYYDFNTCQFDIEGNENVMTARYEKSHSVGWNSATTYYIKCIDSYGVENSGCAVEVRPNSFEVQII